MRASHSLKGAARIVGLDAVVRLTHAMEDRFVAAQDGDSLDSADIDRMLAATDWLAKLQALGGRLAAGLKQMPRPWTNARQRCGNRRRRLRKRSRMRPRLRRQAAAAERKIRSAAAPPSKPDPSSAPARAASQAARAARQPVAEDIFAQPAQDERSGARTHGTHDRRAVRSSVVVIGGDPGGCAPALRLGDVA